MTQATQPRLWLIVASIVALIGLAPGAKATTGCVPQRAIDASVDDLVVGIHYNYGCALPWLALKRAARQPGGLQRLLAAYAEVRTPSNGVAVDEMVMTARAAAGDTAPLVAFYDGNIKLHPSDKSLLNASCWIRGRLDADLKHALPFCDAAVAYQREGYVLANRAKVELLMNNYPAARADYDEALGAKDFKHHPMRPEALYGRGIARLRLGDTAGRDDLDAAVAAQPFLAEIFADDGLTP